MHQEEYINANWGLRYIWEKKEIEIFNDSKYIVYVALDDPPLLVGLDPGVHASHFITNDTVKVTISYYARNKETVYLCTKLLLNKGKRLRVGE